MVTSSFHKGRNELRITLKGDLISTNVVEHGKAIHFAAESYPEAAKTILDLATAKMVDSVGLNLLLSFVKKLNEADRRLNLIVHSRSVERVCNMVYLNQMADVEFKEPRRL